MTSVPRLTKFRVLKSQESREGFVSPRRLDEVRADCARSTEPTGVECQAGSLVTDLSSNPCSLHRTEFLVEVPACGVKEPEVPLSLLSCREELKLVPTVHASRDLFQDFPYKGAHNDRLHLLSKRNTFDVSDLLCEVNARLGPEEGDGPPERLELNETDLLNELTLDTPVDMSNNPYTVLSDDPQECSMSRALAGRARKLVRWFKSFGLPVIQDPPDLIPCGGLKAAVRSCFPDVDPIWELSFKTVQKIERSCCKFCLPSFEEKLSAWKEARLKPQPVDGEHLATFKEALRRNVDKGWDRRRSPFIPNGNATLQSTRRDGGNWNVEEFSEDFRTELVFSSGKPRIVTLYSARNTELLLPLHHSLYSFLRRRGWLLVGDPTSEHINKLNGAELLSFDYSSATDNIKTAYVRSAIDVLIEQSDGLTDDELRALRVLGDLSIDGVRCGSGQPMGSAMSFPLLCLINKTVVDLAMNGLLTGKKISFKEWSSHRLLINGDDLVLREVRSNTNLRGAIADEGSKVGLIVNHEKTMHHDSLCEINSTLFSDGNHVRKFNASAIWMDPGVEDVLGFAAEASHNVETFRRIVRQNANILAKSENKHLSELPAHLQVCCRKDAKIRRALTSMPKNVAPSVKGVIQMAPRPDGYWLDRSEELRSMSGEVDRLREVGLKWAMARASRRRFKTTAVPNCRSYSQVLKKRQTAEQELIPACYVRTYVNKMRDALVEEYVAGSSVIEKCDPIWSENVSKITILCDNLRLFNQERAVSTSRTILRDDFASSSNFVSLN